MKIYQHRISTFALSLVLGLFAHAVHALPPQAEADKLAIEAKAAMDANNYSVAAEKFARMERLNVRLPATFAYHYGVALSESGEYGKAKVQLDKYITKAGTNGKFYREALEMFTKTEDREKAAVLRMQKEKEYSARMEIYQVAKARYDQQYTEYREAVDACEESTSRRWRAEACTFRIPDGISDPNAWLDKCAKTIKLNTVQCQNVPERPAPPQIPSKD